MYGTSRYIGSISCSGGTWVDFHDRDFSWFSSVPEAEDVT
jgi:hypothetical protein